MPPGNDALAKLFGDIAARFQAIPQIAGDLPTMRSVMNDFQAVAGEPTEVMYEDEPGVVGMGPALWCIPLAARDSPNVIIYSHGGGFLANCPASHRKMGGHIAKAAGCKMLMLDYRLAPEHRFPAQIEDAVAAYKFLLSKGYKPENIATSGDSAGGNLCTSMVLKLRDLGEKLPAAIAPISPWYDMEFTLPSMDSNTETDALVNRGLLGNMRGAFLPEEEHKNPLANLLYADLKGLPPMHICVGSYETLLDDSKKFAEKAKAAGVEVELEIANGMQHIYPFMAGKHESSDRSIANIGKFFKAHFK